MLLDEVQPLKAGSFGKAFVVNGSGAFGLVVNKGTRFGSCPYGYILIFYFLKDADYQLVGTTSDTYCIYSILRR
jgi:hypothetical protein